MQFTRRGGLVDTVAAHAEVITLHFKASRGTSLYLLTEAAGVGSATTLALAATVVAVLVATVVAVLVATEVAVVVEMVDASRRNSAGKAAFLDGETDGSPDTDDAQDEVKTRSILSRCRQTLRGTSPLHHAQRYNSRVCCR